MTEIRQETMMATNRHGEIMLNRNEMTTTIQRNLQEITRHNLKEAITIAANQREAIHLHPLDLQCQVILVVDQMAAAEADQAAVGEEDKN